MGLQVRADEIMVDQSPEFLADASTEGTDPFGVSISSKYYFTMRSRMRDVLAPVSSLYSS